jgi:hypothetical protein
MQRYGVSVTGSGATSENLTRLEEGLRYYNASQHLRGLRRIELVDSLTTPTGVPQGVLGVWIPEAGGAVIKLFAGQALGTRGRVIDRHSVVHELAHHVCEGSQPQFGQRLLQVAQGGVQPVPTEYAMTSNAEFQAEVTSTHLRGPAQTIPGYRYDYRPAPALVSLVRQNFARTAI